MVTYHINKLQAKLVNTGRTVVLAASEKRCPVHPLFENFEEFPDPITLDLITGEIPEWLSGSIVRVGPGKFQYGKHRVKHWFDGHGIVHRFNISDGKVSFQSRYVESDVYKKNTAAQRLTIVEFGTLITPDPCESYLSRFKSRFISPDTDNVNVNVLRRGDKLLVMSDGPNLQIMDLNLETLCRQDAQEILSVHLTTSHPHIGSDGELYNLASSFKCRPVTHIIKIPPPTEGDKPDELLCKSKIIASIPSSKALSCSYAHSFGMTENYFIYCETAVRVNFCKMMKYCLRTMPFNGCMEYNANDMAILHIVNRSDGAISPVKYHAKGMFFFHTINCYEDDGHIVWDFIGYDKFNLEDLLTGRLEDLHNGRWVNPDENRCMLEQCPKRIVLPLNVPSGVKKSANLVKLKYTTASARLTGINTLLIKEENLLPKGMDLLEMPQINYEMVNGRPYRYFYGTGFISNQYFMNGLGKIDVRNKTSTRWKGSVNQYPSEPNFVRRPGATDEDDGVILSTVCDTDPDKSDFLLVLNASTFEEIARAYVPEHVSTPFSYHGSFYES